MRSLAIKLGLVVLFWALIAGWQIGACELANVELQDDMQDIASQIGTRIGVTQMTTDQELRDAVIRKATRYDIELEPAQITVQRMGSGQTTTVYLAADYTVPVKVPAFSFTLRFTPSTSKRLMAWRTRG